MLERTRNLLLATAVVLAACSDRPLTTETAEIATSSPEFSVVGTATVTTAADAGAGSLRQAILNAPAGATTTIHFATDLPYHAITLSSGELSIADKHIILDASPGSLLISAGSSSRVFNVAASGELDLKNIIVQDGKADDGAGILNAGTLTLEGSTIRFNNATRNGAGIYSTGVVTVNSSEIRQNTAGQGFYPRGAGIYMDGGSVTLLNSVLYNNVFPDGFGDGAQIAMVDGVLDMNGGSLSGNATTYQAQRATGLWMSGGTATLEGITIAGLSAHGTIGPIHQRGGTLTIMRSFIGPNTVQSEPDGALIYHEAGTLVAHYNFMRGAAAVRVVHHVDGPIDIENNWWGCNDGPNHGGCGATRNVTPSTWLVIAFTATPPAIEFGGTSTLKLDGSRNSAGEVMDPANLSVYAGRHFNFVNASRGTVSPSGVTLNSSFQATATFTGGTTSAGVGGVSASTQYNFAGTLQSVSLRVNLQVGPTNAAPVADAGVDQTVQCTGATTGVQLNGSASSDPDGDPLTYTWKEDNVVIAGSAEPTVQLTHGMHTIALEISDGTALASDNVAINVVDTEAPAVTRNGNATVGVELGDSYTDAGATASDACEGAVAVQTSGSVNTNAVGDYTLTYTATDSHGNSASASRVVNVRDTRPPVVTLNGSANVALELGVDSYVEAGATAVDVVNGSIPVQITGSVNSGAAGTYIITYTATDPSGNSASKTRTVVVSDTRAPEIAVGAAPLTLSPPNHKYVTVALSALGLTVQDASGVSAQDVVITTVTSDEADNGLGDGDTPNDMVVATDGRSVQLRAERAGNGNGRVYVIHLGVRDASGNLGSATYAVSVQKNAKRAAVMDAAVNSVAGVNP